MADIINTLLKRFHGEYKKALIGKLKIVFKLSSDMKAKATYKSELDELWIRNSVDTLKLIGQDLYGWLPYIIVHELGHRYENLYGLPSWFNSSYITSKYSISAGFADEEKWAECFAIAFFGQSIHPDYTNWQNVITKFKINFEG